MNGEEAEEVYANLQAWSDQILDKDGSTVRHVDVRSLGREDFKILCEAVSAATRWRSRAAEMDLNPLQALLDLAKLADAGKDDHVMEAARRAMAEKPDEAAAVLAKYGLDRGDVISMTAGA
jgi:hypothetical protein